VDEDLQVAARAAGEIIAGEVVLELSSTLAIEAYQAA